MRFGDVTALPAAFEREGVRYVLIGSMAMAAWGVVRATQDIDFFVDPEADNVDRLRRALWCSRTTASRRSPATTSRVRIR